MSSRTLIPAYLLLGNLGGGGGYERVLVQLTLRRSKTFNMRDTTLTLLQNVACRAYSYCNLYCGYVTIYIFDFYVCLVKSAGLLL